MYKQCLHLTLLHSEQPKLYGVLAVLSAIGLNSVNIIRRLHYGFSPYINYLGKTKPEISFHMTFVEVAIKGR